MSPSPRLFRSVAIASILVSVAAAVLPSLGFSGLDPEVAALTQYSTHGSPLTNDVLYWASIALAALSLIGILGLLAFWAPARLMLAAALAGSVVLSLFSGLGIYSPAEAFLGGLGSITMVWLITVSWWSPLATKFVRSSASA